MKSYRLVVTLLALASLCACAATTLAPSDIRMLPYVRHDAHQPLHWPTNAPVPGLRYAIEEAAKDNRPVKLLTIHGMVVSESGFSSEWQNAIAKELGLVKDDVPERVKLFRGYDMSLYYGQASPDPVPAKMQSQISRTVWRKDKTSPPALIVYELFWAPFRDDIKYRYLGCFESRSASADRDAAEVQWDCPIQDAARNNGSRAWINGMIKDGLMVRGFADAVILNGALGDILRDDLTLATCVMAVDTLAYLKAPPRAGEKMSSTVMQSYSAKRCDPASLGGDVSSILPIPHGKDHNLEYFVLTHSLGSYFFLEAQARREFNDHVDNSDYVQFAMFDEANVFMFANQVSLLSLANLGVICETPAASSRCPNFRLKTLEEAEFRAGGNLSTYVAFNDADDDLGFELPPFLADAGLGRLINVTVHNPALSLPFIIRNPADVHTSQERNPAIINALVSGITIPETPKP